jgi:hypothetical protein
MARIQWTGTTILSAKELTAAWQFCDRFNVAERGNDASEIDRLL